MPEAFAPAKINLFLHVGAPGPDGRHPVCSLAVFADVGDRLSAEPAGRFSLEVTGPFAGEVGTEADNLVTRALASVGAPPMAVRLDKQLPVASGLGGGSSDAGAALRLAAMLSPDIGQGVIDAAALRLGADGLLCLRAVAAVATGEGEILSPAPAMPPLWAVLVNPGAPSSTGAVYRAYDEGPAAFSADRPGMPSRFEDVASVVTFLETARNDLEAPAVRLEPAIGEVLEAVRATAGIVFARMSGSGATVFGLCADQASARAASTLLKAARPGWWVVETCLN